MASNLIATVSGDAAMPYHPGEQVKLGDLTFDVLPLDGSGKLKGLSNAVLLKPAFTDQLSPWNTALLAAKYLPKGSPVEFEPDIEHPPICEYPDEELKADVCETGKYNDYWDQPKDTEFAWHLDDDRTQLRLALSRVGDAGDGKRIRIGHIDTGYDPSFQYLPLHLLREKGVSFVKGEQGRNAEDPGNSGGLRQPGHGTGTIHLLAGQKVVYNDGTINYNDYIGAAPFSEVLPIRAANSVIVAFNTSAIVNAINYAVQEGCQVISMSMGGLPSKAMAQAVNAAYEAGVLMVTATGDNFGNFPTPFVIYPARFDRVLAACGVTYGNTPYYRPDCLPNEMQGNCGPKKLMKYALSAYSPNVPWAKFRCTTMFRKAGAGTSSSTPQIAAAAALWLQKYSDQHYAQPWQRVEAVRNALFASAKTVSMKNMDYYLGKGILQANAALDIKPRLMTEKAEPAEIRHRWLRTIFGFGDTSDNIYDNMLVMETSHRIMQNWHLGKLAAQADTGTFLQKRKARRQLMDALIGSPEVSDELTKMMQKKYTEDLNA